MKFKAVLFIFLAIALNTEAASKKSKRSRKPSSSLVNEFTTNIVFGDKISTFKIWTEKKDHKFTFSNSDGIEREGNLSGKNFKYLNSKVLKIRKSVSNKPELCPRNLIALNIGYKGSNYNKIGCIQSNTKIAKELKELVNILDLLL